MSFRSRTAQPEALSPDAPVKLARLRVLSQNAVFEELTCSGLLKIQESPAASDVERRRAARRDAGARSVAAANRSPTAVSSSGRRPEPNLIAVGGTRAEGEA